MIEPYLGEIRMVGFSYAPVGWLACDGALLTIANYPMLYSVIGTTYGGDGVKTFALPDLRGRIPLHQGQGAGLTARTLGERGGAESVSLTPDELPAHRLFLAGPGGTATEKSTATQLTSSRPHDNMHPYQAVNFIMAVEGIYPSGN